MRLLDHDEVVKKIRYPTSRAQIWRLEREGKFPRHVKAGQRNVWLENEIDQYIADRISERDSRVTEQAA